jgi:Zn-dependent peptidase ImmA (M78 family)
VIVNSTMPPDRIRLTLAHELGHLVMHDGHVSFDPEVDANKFAAEFLMPESTIAPELRKSRLDLGALADFKIEWRVSMQALFERARSLGYTNDDDRRRFYIAMNKRGWKVSEPNGEYCTEPSPRLLGSVLEQMASGGYDATDIANVSGYAELPPLFAVGGRGGLRLV